MNILGLILTNKMAAMLIFQLFFTSQEQKLLQVEISNLQDIFVITKSCLGIFFASLKKNKMATTGVSLSLIAQLVCRDFLRLLTSSGAKSIIDRVFKFAGYVYHYKFLPWNIFGLNLKNRMAWFLYVLRLFHL